MRYVKNRHILYIISYKNDYLIKIGKTRESNRINRYKQIIKDFKKINLNKSYEFYSTEEEISNLERILHKYYFKQRKPNHFKRGIGKSEWFKGNIKKTIFKDLKNIKKSSVNFTKIKGPYKIKDIKNKKHINYLSYLYIFVIFSFIVYFLIPK